jgi:hypothetical protein
MNDPSNPNLARLNELEEIVAKESNSIKDHGVEEALKNFFGPKETAAPGSDPISEANKKNK